jgi:hypothetical protein
VSERIRRGLSGTVVTASVAGSTGATSGRPRAASQVTLTAASPSVEASMQSSTSSRPRSSSAASAASARSAAFATASSPSAGTVKVAGAGKT